MFKKTLIATALVAATAIPAAAQQISIDYSAQSQEEADLIRGGLVLYQIANGGDPVQVLTQAANGSVGVVHQEGVGHSASLAQNGNAAGGIFQFGNNTNANLVQGNGDADLTFVFGW